MFKTVMKKQANCYVGNQYFTFYRGPILNQNND